jgi:hypothetical protein
MIMLTRKLASRAGLALSLVVGIPGATIAATQPAHDGHGAPAVELRRDNGEKWQTDDALREGMAEIRTVLSTSLARIHEGRFTAAEFAELADRVNEQVDYVAANCKLPEQADLQLHVVLAQLLEGAGAMKGVAGREEGAVALIEALNAYGEHFDHPGWQPLGL